MLSVVAGGGAGAGEAIRQEAVRQDQQLAQMDQAKPAGSSSGSCMPIGVTARGELVFPWDCREIIERERGPISIDLSPPKASAPSLPIASEPVPKAAAASDPAPKEQPASQRAEPEHVATIPDAAASPPPASTIAQPVDRRLAGKRLSSRRPGDPKTARSSPAQPIATPSNRQSRSPVPPPS
jgi:hypothetical protein